MSFKKVLIIEEIDLPGAEVYYIRNVIDDPEKYFELLLKEVPWKQEQTFVYGKHNQPRLTCLLGPIDKPYTYSGIARIPVPMSETIIMLTRIVQNIVNIICPDHPLYTTTLGNRYRNGHDYIAQHSDSESDMVDDAIIASLSLGENRFFDFYDKETRKRVLRLELEKGSLLLMGKNSQNLYTHGVPKQLTKKGERLNFTWRVMKENNNTKRKLDRQKLVEKLIKENK